MASNQAVLNAKEVSESSEKSADSPTADQKSHSSNLSSSSQPSRSSISTESSDHEDYIDVQNEEDEDHSRSRGFGDVLSKKNTGRSIATNATTDPAFEVDFEDDDPGDPRNWPLWYRSTIIFFISYSTATW